MNKVMVTGANGFIGSALCRELVHNGTEVIAVIRNRDSDISRIKNLNGIRTVYCDMSEYDKVPEIVKDRDIDTIFHMAWQGVSGDDARDEGIQLHNLKSTLDLIDASKKMGIETFIGCGSIHEKELLADIAQDKPVDNMSYMYRAAKFAAHCMGKAKAGSYGIRFFWPIITNAYGEGEYSERLINSLIRKIFEGIIPDLSNGNQYYDFVHVSDVAKAFYLIAKKGIDGTNYTIGSGYPRPLKEYLKTVGNIANQINHSSVELGFGKIKNNVISLPKSDFDTLSLYKDTGFKISISFESGIERTAHWIRNSMNIIQNTE